MSEQTHRDAAIEAARDKWLTISSDAKPCPVAFGYDAGYLAAKQEPCQNCGHSTDPLWAEKAEHCFKCNRHQSKCICESDRPDARQAECEEKQ
jgi:hypothetical protein